MDVRSELRSAFQLLSSRGLKLAAKWAAELCVGLPDAPGSFAADDAAAVGEHMDDRYMLSKSYFDLGEYQRAAEVLNKSGTSATLDPKALFLRGYALYLVRPKLFFCPKPHISLQAGEKRKEEEMVERTGHSSSAPVCLSSGCDITPLCLPPFRPCWCTQIPWSVVRL